MLKVWDHFVGLPLKTRSACEIFNLGMRLGGKFHYDRPTLIGIAAECGLRAYEVAFAQSEHEALRGIDLRRPEDGVSMYMECVRAGT